MTIRSEALRWLRKQGVQDGHIVTSKRYTPDESWTKEKAWWVQVPLSVVDAGETVHIVCEAEPGAGAFRHLEVPGSFFQQHLRDFAILGGDRINLFLAAERGLNLKINGAQDTSRSRDSSNSTLSVRRRHTSRTDYMHPDTPGEGGSAAAAARLALLALRGSIHPVMRLQPDAYALATAPDAVMTAEALLPAFVAAPKPLRCRATASHGVVKVHLGAPRGGALARLAWDTAGNDAVNDDLEGYLARRAAAARRRLAELPVLCAAREEVHLCSLADVARWHREYQLVTGGYAFDDADNELAAQWPLYREARARGVPYVLRLGDIPTAA